MQYLSKSDYRTARSCGTKLFYRKEKYPSSADGDEYRELLVEGGYMIEATARVLHPDGIVVDDSPGGTFDRESAAERTMQLLQRENVTLLGATFIHGALVARADIIRKRGNRLDLIEVKAKSFNTEEQQIRDAAGKPSIFRAKIKPFGVASQWRETIEDVAFQHHVITRAFPEFDVHARLLLVDSCKVTPIESLHAQFRMTYTQKSDGTLAVSGGEFTGNANALRAGHTLVERLVDEEVALVAADVNEAIETYLASLFPARTRIAPALTAACKGCEFRVTLAIDTDAQNSPDAQDTRNGFGECWGALASASPHMLDLFKIGATKIDSETLVDHMVSSNKSGLFDIPVEKLVKKDGTVGSIARRQTVQIAHTQSNTPWFDESLRDAVQSAVYPLHFIDFETSTLAVPYHAGMRPYEQVAFQWSCHTVHSLGAEPVHSEWINTNDAWPNLSFAESLRAQLGNSGTVLMWASHERTVLRAINEQLDRYGKNNTPLRDWIEQLTAKDDASPSRLLDMHDLCTRAFFHPGMAGRTSIKKVLSALLKSEQSLRERCATLMHFSGNAPADPYSALPPLEIGDREESVQEGTGAMRAYQSMLYGPLRNNDHDKEQWRALLLQYCKLDTLAMVLIWEHWQRLVAA